MSWLALRSILLTLTKIRLSNEGFLQSNMSWEINMANLYGPDAVPS